MARTGSGCDAGSFQNWRGRAQKEVLRRTLTTQPLQAREMPCFLSRLSVFMLLLTAVVASLPRFLPVVAIGLMTVLGDDPDTSDSRTLVVSAGSDDGEDDSEDDVPGYDSDEEGVAPALNALSFVRRPTDSIRYQGATGQAALHHAQQGGLFGTGGSGGIRSKLDEECPGWGLIAFSTFRKVKLFQTRVSWPLCLLLCSASLRRRRHVAY